MAKQVGPAVPVDEASTLKRAVDNVEGFIQDACGDIASDMMQMGSGFLDPQWKRKLDKAKKAGCMDLQGWLADELYNDPQTLEDLIADRLHDEVKGNEEHFQKCLVMMLKGAHPGLKKAIKSIQKRHAE